MRKKNIFLTGATGVMGGEGLKQLLKRRDKFDITLLIRPSKKNKEKMADFENEHGVKIIWGDFTNYDDVLKCVTLADYILHVGATVSPACDFDSLEKIIKINVGSTKNIINAIKAQSNPDNKKLVYIGTVAETGDRMPPLHWGRIGDPLKPSIYDNYAVSKIAAEREVIESGLKYWVSLRQTGILSHKLQRKELVETDGIRFHQPLNNPLEWVTAHDSGLLLANVCEDYIPEDFWGRVYNIGGGPGCRITNYDYLKKSFGLMGIDVQEVVDPSWYATRNFHGQWYLDSDILNNYLHFQTQSIDDYLKELINAMKSNSPKNAGPIPPSIIKQQQEKVGRLKSGTLYWLENNKEQRIKAFFGSREKWAQIPSWDEYKNDTYVSKPIILDHGYDESKPKSELDINDMKQAAKFRGGECLSSEMEKGNLKTKLKWRCAFGHEFEASPTLVLLTGHWCPECEPAPWNYGEIAKRNPFFAQVWYPIHDKDENDYYDKNCNQDVL